MVSGLCSLDILVAAIAGERPKAYRLTRKRFDANEFTCFSRFAPRAQGRERLHCHPKHPTLYLAAIYRKRSVHSRKERTDVRTTWNREGVSGAGHRTTVDDRIPVIDPRMTLDEISSYTKSNKEAASGEPVE